MSSTEQLAAAQRSDAVQPAPDADALAASMTPAQILHNLRNLLDDERHHGTEISVATLTATIAHIEAQHQRIAELQRSKQAAEAKLQRVRELAEGWLECAQETGPANRIVSGWAECGAEIIAALDAQEGK